MKPYDAVNCATIFRFVFITMITYTAEKLRIIGLSYGEIARRSFTSLIYIYIYIYIYIQGVTGGMDQTSGECSLC